MNTPPSVLGGLLVLAASLGLCACASSNAGPAVAARSKPAVPGAAIANAAPVGAAPSTAGPALRAPEGYRQVGSNIPVYITPAPMSDADKSYFGDLLGRFPGSWGPRS